MKTVSIIEMYNTTLGLCFKVKNDTEYCINQTIRTESGDAYKIKDINFSTTPQIENSVILICDKTEV